MAASGSVATTGLLTKANAPGIGTPQSVFAVRARTRALVDPDQSKFEPWRNGMRYVPVCILRRLLAVAHCTPSLARRKRVDQRKELLIASTAKEWIPNGCKQARERAGKAKVEKITEGFMCTPHRAWPKRRPSLTCLAAQTRRRTRSRTWSRRGLFVFFQYKVEYVHMWGQPTMSYC